MKRGLKFYFFTARGKEVLRLPDSILFLFVSRIIPQIQVKIYILMKKIGGRSRKPIEIASVIRCVNQGKGSPL